MFADLALARRLEGVFAETLSRFAMACATAYPELGAGVLPVGGGVAAYAGPNIGSLTSSVGLGLNGPVTAADFEQLEAFYRERNGEPIVSVCPFADRSLLDLLIQRGYSLFSPFSILYRPLPADAAGGTSRMSTNGPTGDTQYPVTVERVSSATAAVWGQTVAAGFLGQDDAEQTMFEPIKLRCPDTICYLARINGEPAGGAVTTIVKGAAYFWSASTRPSYRRKGVQAALLHAQMDEAAAAGCDLGVLATEIGNNSQRNAQRAGFHVAYTILDFVLGGGSES